MVVEELYQRWVEHDGEAAAFIEVSSLAKLVGADARRVAMVCKSLVQHGHVDGDGDMMGLVKLSNNGAQYYRSVQELSQ